MERIARNINYDQIYETLRELAQTSLNGNWESLVDTEKFEKLKAGKQEQLSVHSILMPSVLDGFKSVTIGVGKLHRLNGLSAMERYGGFQGGSGSNVVIAMRLSKQRNNGSNLAHILEPAMQLFQLCPVVEICRNASRSNREESWKSKLIWPITG